jgi:hypothetical protein
MLQPRMKIVTFPLVFGSLPLVPFVRPAENHTCACTHVTHLCCAEYNGKEGKVKVGPIPAAKCGIGMLEFLCVNA